MNETDKKLNQILNLLNLIHNENTFFLNIIKTVYVNESDRNKMDEYIKTCEIQKQCILSGMYEDEITITH